MRQVYAFRIDEHDKIYKNIKTMSRVAKDLYNQALWEVRQHYYKTAKILSHSQLDKLMKQRENLEGIVNYRLLPAKVTQHVLQLLVQNITTYYQALDDYQKNKSKYKAAPNFPCFLPKEGFLVMIFTNQQAAIKPDGFIKLTKKLKISVPEREFAKYQQFFFCRNGKKTEPRFAQVRIVPKFNGAFFRVEIIYDRPEINSDVDLNRVAAIDLGVNNLGAIVDSEMANEQRTPILINGKAIKSVNQYYNKQRAKLQDDPDKPETKQLIKITDIRNCKVDDILHKSSRFIVQYCLQHRIGHIVIGYNPDWKQSVNLGKRNNQNFVQIPFRRLIHMITYKAELVGIKVTTQPEAYTSKCSALDLEIIAKHDDHVYAGKRIKRGLFASTLGYINADVNAALNILRKTIGDRFLIPFVTKVARLIPSSGYLSYPLKICL